MSRQAGTIGRYQVREAIGAGGFASVYRAYDPLLDVERAVKVLHPHLTRDRDVRERFVREGRALARISHPNLVQVVDAGEEGDSAYLAMTLIRGRSLRELLDQHGSVPPRHVASLVTQVAGALAAIHAVGLIHRDVKPDNILVEDGTNRAVLLDLGVARDTANVTLTAGAVIGTPGYMAPEQLDTRPITAQTDVYQLAATAYALFTGRPPFEGSTTRVLMAVASLPPPDVRALRAELPAAVAETLAAGMAKDPALRPSGVRAFARQFESGVAGSAEPEPTPQPLPPGATLVAPLPARTVPEMPAAADLTVPAFPMESSPAQPTIIGGPGIPFPPQPVGVDQIPQIRVGPRYDRPPPSRQRRWPLIVGGAALLVVAVVAVAALRGGSATRDGSSAQPGARATLPASAVSPVASPQATAVGDPGVVARDDFSSAERGIFDLTGQNTSLVRFSYEGGEFVIRKIDGSSPNVPTINLPKPVPDAALAVDARVTGETRGREAVLLCRFRGPSGYWLIFTPDGGRLHLGRLDNGAETTLADRTVALGHPATAATRLELRCAGGEIAVAVDGVQMVAVQDRTYGDGDWGIGAGVAGELLPATSEVHFDNLLYTRR